MMKNNHVHCRPETPKDFPKIYDVNSMAFEKSEEAKLVDKLRGAKSFIPQLSIVATKDDIVIGHILFTPIEIINGATRYESLALAPVAVTPSCQNKGVGSMLIRYGLDKAKELGYTSVIVLGHENYYPRFQFTPASKWNIKAPFNVPEKSFMALELIPDALSNVSGVVDYPKEFDV